MLSDACRFPISLLTGVYFFTHLFKRTAFIPLETNEMDHIAHLAHKIVPSFQVNFDECFSLEQKKMHMFSHSCVVSSHKIFEFHFE